MYVIKRDIDSYSFCLTYNIFATDLNGGPKKISIVLQNELLVLLIWSVTQTSGKTLSQTSGKTSG